MNAIKDRYQPDIVRSIYGDAYSSLIPVLALVYVLISSIFYGSPFLKESMEKWWAIAFVSFSVNLIVVAAWVISDRKKKDRLDYSLWAYRYDAISFITGLSHGYFCMMLNIANEMVAMSYIGMILATAIGSAVNAGLRPLSNACYLSPIFIMSGINFWHSDFFMAFILTVAIATLLTTAFSYKGINILKKSIDLRFENNELIEELKEQKEAEREANLDKSRFISAASHDLRQPLQSTNFMFAALKSKLTSESQKELFNKTQKSLDSLNLMIDSLLDISRFDSGELQITLKHFYIDETIKNEITTHSPKATKKGLAIHYLCDEKLEVYSDPIILQRIISNLLDNAVKYTSSGEITVKAQIIDQHFCLEVSDSGIGIPEKYHSEIFKEFYQVGNPERDRRKGIGLGLSIIKRLVDQLDGTISLESEEGRGSSFKVTLPLHSMKKDADLRSALAEQQKFDIINRRVIIIDDDHDVLESLELLLEDWGVWTLSASSGEDAIERIKQITDPHFDAIVADYRLRDKKTGLDAISSIKKHLNLSDLPALIITGDTEPKVINRIKKSGVRMLGKPINAEQLHSELIKLIDKEPTREPSSALA